MKKAVIVMSAKGGVGKTTFARFVGETRVRGGVLVLRSDDQE